MTDLQSAPARTEITVRNPADGSVVGTVPVDGPETVAAKARALRDAQPEWEAIGARGRKPWLLAMQDWILDNTEHLADVLQSETGKPRTDAAMEPPLTADLLNYWARHAEGFLADRHPAAHSPLMRVKRLTTVYRPYPVVGVIIPWNFPLLNIALDGVAALAAGAAMLLKPSEVTPLSAVEFARGWTEIGAPPVLALTTGYAETGGAVIAAADCVHFTGSTATGRKVAVACAERLIPCTLELGGKDPAIVLADADLDRAAAGIAWGGMFNAGQVCVSIERVYVEAPVYDEFVAKLTGEVARLRQGQDDDRLPLRCRSHGHRGATRHRDAPCRRRRRRRRAGDHGWPGDRRRDVLRADGARRRRAVDDVYAGGDLRPDAARGQGRRRGRGDPAGQRLGVRVVGHGVDR